MAAPDDKGLDALGAGAIDPLQVARRVAEQAFAMIPGAEGALLGLLADSSALQYVCGTGTLSDFVGERLMLEGSLSGDAIARRHTLITHDTERDPRVNLEATRAFGVRSLVCVPLLRGHEALGVLSVGSSAAHAFGARDVALLSDLADFVSTAVGAAADVERITARLLAPGSDGPDEDRHAQAEFVANVLDPTRAETVAARREIEEILRDRRFSLLFQPVFNLYTGELFGVEALARFPAEPRRPPNVWFAQADAVGLGVELQVAIIEMAAECLSQLPPQANLAINVGPHVIGVADIASALAGADPQRIVLELTEQVEVEDYPQLARTLIALRDAGVRLAIDDTGAGFSSLMHVIRLAPDFIKLDRQLTCGVDLDPVRRSLASSLVLFAAETGATIVAEGIENADELDALRLLGIEYGQGYHLARPTAIGEIEEAVEHAASRWAWQL